jgi:cell wall-associated NlpC family hydrolase
MRKTRAVGLLGMITTLLLAGGCAGTSARDSRIEGGIGSPSSDARDSIARLALSMVGVPYRYGGASPREGFDCSGLVYYTYASNGHAVPRTSRDQFDTASKISLAEAAVGDLVFFQDQEKLSHVGIYLGDGRFVHAPSSGSAVSVANLDAPYYQRHLVGVGRLIP